MFHYFHTCVIAGKNERQDVDPIKLVLIYQMKIL